MARRGKHGRHAPLPARRPTLARRLRGWRPWSGLRFAAWAAAPWMMAGGVLVSFTASAGYHNPGANFSLAPDRARPLAPLGLAAAPVRLAALRLDELGARFAPEADENAGETDPDATPKASAGRREAHAPAAIEVNRARKGDMLPPSLRGSVSRLDRAAERARDAEAAQAGLEFAMFNLDEDALTPSAFRPPDGEAVAPGPDLAPVSLAAMRAASSPNAVSPGAGGAADAGTRTRDAGAEPGLPGGGWGGSLGGSFGGWSPVPGPVGGPVRRESDGRRALRLANPEGATPASPRATALASATPAPAEAVPVSIAGAPVSLDATPGSRRGRIVLAARPDASPADPSRNGGTAPDEGVTTAAKPEGASRYAALLANARAERELKCLAQAVYFEARSEPESGQAAVAQVVLNRAQSGLYPDNVCGVVFQNRHRYLACQFTFACEGKSLRITDAASWATAERVARAVAEGRTYMNGVGGATHYHADYVRPYWARSMRKMDRIGRHIFYKPDGRG